MVWAALALCFRFSADLVKAALATLIIGAILSTTEQHANPSASILQGFQCIPASDLPATDILAFAQGLQNGTAELSAAQLSCLARLLAAKNLTADFNKYPPDLLLFFDLAEVHSATCGAFYAQASRGNLALLPRGSVRRRALLRGALACLGVRGSHLGPEQLSSLGALVCDMEPETITSSDLSILENLKLCPALTGAQQDALNAVLLRGGTVYGDPSSWDLWTLQSLGPLVLTLNQTTLSLVTKAAREAFGRSIVATYSSQGRSQRERSLTLLRAFTAVSAPSQPRLKRSADRCLSAPITASTTSDSLLIISYNTTEQFDLCLSNEVLKANLVSLLEQPLTLDYFRVVKKKLEQIYPSGIPEEQLRLLGPLARQYTVEEISLWPVTSSDTLLALLNPSDGKWESAQVQQLVSRYLALGGTLTGPLLRKIGGRHLCNLQEEQIGQIPPEAIRTAGQLDISSCSQTKKDQLYGKAKQAFAGQPGTTRTYYCRIWPYLGGAPATDLKDLAKGGVPVDMDIDTFLTLNPDEVQKLSVMDVKNLLGENLPHLKKAENETLVMSWVKRQSQRELDCTLGIGLQGGMEESSTAGTATPPHLTTLASITPTATVPTPITLPTVSTPTATSSHPTTYLSTGSHKTSPPSAISPTPSNSTQPRTPARTYTPAPSAAMSPAATSTTQPAPTTNSTIPCSIQPSASPPTATLLTTILAAVSPNTTSPSSVTPPALTRSTTTSTTAVVVSPNTTSPSSVPPPALTRSTTTSTTAAVVSPQTTSPSSVPPPALTRSTTTSTTAVVVSPNTTSPSSIPPPALTRSTTTSTTAVVVSPNTTSPSFVPPPALTHGATTTILVTNPAVTTHNTSTSLVSTNPSASGGTTHPATHNTTTPSMHNTPSTLLPNSTSAPAATTATEMNLPPHKPTSVSNSTASTQKSGISSEAKTTTLACQTAAPTALLSPSSTTTSDTTKETPAAMPETPKPTRGGYINLQPEPGSGSTLSSCLAHVLMAAVGSTMLRGLL